MLTDEERLEKHIQELIKEKKFQDVMKLLKTSKNEAFVKSNAWNLITQICSTLKQENLLQNDNEIFDCREILLYISEQGNPKEMLIALMEEADSFKDDEYFCLILKPLQETLKKIPGKKGNSLEWVLDTLNAHIESLSQPEDLDLQGKENLLLDADPSVISTCYVLKNYLLFLEPFIEEVSYKTKNQNEYYVDRMMHQREILQKYILKLFDRPFLYQDLHLDNQMPKSSIRVLCENFIQCLMKISKNIFNLYAFDCDISCQILNSYKDEESNVSRLAISNLAYLIFVENITASRPFVYSHIYMFIENLKFIISLLNKTENLVLFKGLHLNKILLNNLYEFELNNELLELETFIKYVPTLFKVAIYCHNENFRNMAVKIFLDYINKFDWKGRYHIIMQVISSVKHSGAHGLVINLYKDYVHINLYGNSSNAYFFGTNLTRFLKNILILENGVEIDILENSDKIVTSLNLLRYFILLKNKNIELSIILDNINLIIKNFLSDLQTAIDMSRAHYKEKAKEIKDEKNYKNTMNHTTMAKDKFFSNVPLNFQNDIFDQALITFDMIESILCR